MLGHRDKQVQTDRYLSNTKRQNTLCLVQDQRLTLQTIAYAVVVRKPPQPYYPVVSPLVAHMPAAILLAAVVLAPTTLLLAAIMKPPHKRGFLVRKASHQSGAAKRHAADMLLCAP